MRPGGWAVPNLMVHKSNPTRAWSWVDRTQVLDQWYVSATNGHVTLFGLVGVWSGRGYASEYVSAIDGHTELKFFFIVGEDLIAERPNAAIKRLRSGVAKARRNRALDFQSRNTKLQFLGPFAVLPILLAASCAQGAPSGVDDRGLGPTGAGSATSEVDGSDNVSTVCPAIEPLELPSGSPPGEPREVGGPMDERSHEDPTPLTTWGSGNDSVSQAGGEVALKAMGESAFDSESWADEQVVLARGVERIVVPVGDPGQIQILFQQEDCYYINWIGPGISLEDAIEYAGRM